MRKSIWAIIVIGVVGFVAILIMMHEAMSMYTQTEAGQLVPIAIQLKEKFDLEQVSPSFKNTTPPRVLALDYTTRKRSGYDEKVCDEEIRQIVRITLVLMAEKDKKSVVDIAKVAVTRTEIHGSGCFGSQYATSLEVQNPDYKPRELQEREGR